MKVIYKHKVEPGGAVSLPTVTQWLCVDVQHGDTCVWALVERDAPERSYHLSIFGTGHPIQEDYDGEYIDTFQLEGGALVFHAFVDAD